MARIWPARASAPPLFTAFCRDWLSLSGSHTALWWQALTRARWSRAVGLRSMIQCQTALTQDWQQLLRVYEETMTPRELIAVLEELIAEHL
jgi:hypothetical protein